MRSPSTEKNSSGEALRTWRSPRSMWALNPPAWASARSRYQASGRPSNRACSGKVRFTWYVSPAAMASWMAATEAVKPSSSSPGSHIDNR